MKLLWTSDLKINCVHVTDVAKAILHSFKNLKPGQTFNLSDESDLTQGNI
jgi:nucleoside-diphosphate-sugar epimerase